MLNKELEQTLNNLFKKGHDRRWEFVTPDHLFLTLLDDNSVIKCLQEHDADIAEIRNNLTDFLDKNTSLLEDENPGGTQPSLEFQRVIQRAALYTQSEDRNEVLSTDVLKAISMEKGSKSSEILTDIGVFSDLDSDIFLQTTPKITPDNQYVVASPAVFTGYYSANFLPDNKAFVENLIMQTIRHFWNTLPESEQDVERLEKEILRITRQEINNFKDTLKDSES